MGEALLTMLRTHDPDVGATISVEHAGRVAAVLTHAPSGSAGPTASCTATSSGGWTARVELQTTRPLPDGVADAVARLAAEAGPSILPSFTPDAEDLYRALFDVNTAIKLLIDVDSGAIVDANRAAQEFYGLSADELRKRRIMDINTLSEAEVRAEMEAARTQRRLYFNFRHRVANGDIRDVEVYSGPVQVHGRRLLLSIIHDVTERRRLEEQLRQAQKMEAVGRLAGGVAHDFNNLLTAMIGFGELTLEQLSADSPLRENVSQMVRNAQRAEQLTRQLLAFSRHQVLEPRVLNLGNVIRDVELLLQRLLGERHVLRLEIPPDLWHVRADVSQMEQVLVNLVANARDAMPGGGEVRLRAENFTGTSPVRLLGGTMMPGSYVALSVVDRGVGMDNVTLARIFEPFFTTKPKERGTGLGLSTVYGAVQGSGGFIQVESCVGQGTTFTIYLPRFVGAAEDLSRPTAAPPPVAPRGTVLVVEDNDDVRAFLCLSLRLAGHRVLEAPSSKVALELGRDGDAPDLLITDVVMPGMNGPELHSALREHRPDLRVLYISGYTEGLLADEIPREGTRFLQKPFTRKVLLDKVAELLSQPV
ncbi:MAG: ATP-binding protein [Myxococcota bacterium]